MASEGRLFVESEASSNFHSPNFQTVLPRPFLQKEFRELLLHLYEPAHSTSEPSIRFSAGT